MKIVALAALAVVLSATGAAAQQEARPAQAPGQQGGEPAFAVHLFPPELVMQHQARLGLTAEQRTAITDAVKEMTSQAIDLQWRVQDEEQRLIRLIEGARVDQAAALAQIDRMLAIERQVKTAQMVLLIKIKNTLSPQQQTMLRELRDGRGGR